MLHFKCLLLFSTCTFASLRHWAVKSLVSSEACEKLGWEDHFNQVMCAMEAEMLSMDEFRQFAINRLKTIDEPDVRSALCAAFDEVMPGWKNEKVIKQAAYLFSLDDINHLLASDILSEKNIIVCKRIQHYKEAQNELVVLLNAVKLAVQNHNVSDLTKLLRPHRPSLRTRVLAPYEASVWHRNPEACSNFNPQTKVFGWHAFCWFNEGSELVRQEYDSEGRLCLIAKEPLPRTTFSELWWRLLDQAVRYRWVVHIKPFINQMDELIMLFSNSDLDGTFLLDFKRVREESLWWRLVDVVYFIRNKVLTGNGEWVYPSCKQVCDEMKMIEMLLNAGADPDFSDGRYLGGHSAASMVYAWYDADRSDVKQKLVTLFHHARLQKQESVQCAGNAQRLKMADN